VESEEMEGIIEGIDIIKAPDNPNISFGNICILFKLYKPAKNMHGFCVFCLVN
jgi:hypothetical protein